MSLKLLHGVWVVELHVEIFIWLPVIIVSDLNCDELGLLSLLELQGLLNFSVVISSLGLGVDGTNSNLSSGFLFVMDNDLDVARSLGHRVVKALESEVLILKFIINKVGMSMFLLHNLSLSDDSSLSAHEVSNLLSVLDSSEHGVTFNLFLELLEVDSIEVVSLLVLL